MLKIKQKNGFSLIELSIVLVIIGLLIAGVTGGSQIVQGAKFSRLISEVGDLKSSVNAFKTTYQGLPGDITNAEDFWGCTGDAGDCNGSGDGKIRYINTADPGETNESYRAWEQLFLSGLTKFNSTGAAELYNGSSTYIGVIGNAVPGSKYGKGGYSLFTDEAGAALVAMSINKLLIAFGNQAPNGTINGFTREVIISPSDAFLLDRKYDDGLPEGGKIRGFEGPDVYADNFDDVTTDEVCAPDPVSGDRLYAISDSLYCFLAFIIE
jgi:prepilin-type N-terminal cleavage/methylation domain-containing protein